MQGELREMHIWKRLLKMLSGFLPKWRRMLGMRGWLLGMRGWRKVQCMREWEDAG